MVLFQMDLARFITVYIVQLGMGIIYFFIGLLILKRDTKRLNQLFATFYLLSASATIINVIYVSLTITLVVKYLHILTFYLFCFAIVYLLIFNLILLKSEKVFPIKKHNLIALIYGILLFGIVFIPKGVTIDASTDWRPVWSLPFLLYALVVLTCCATVPTTYYSLQVYKKLESEELKKRWAYNIVAILGYFAILYLTSISNYLNNPTFRLITSIAGLTLFVTAYLLYYSVGRQIEK
ncbi:MAG: hypothetical protein EU535_02510 [Promethearchaeota archaeon]|nr:MAG: hypothetical protein EU535_02510 [Candidatus Lokiarchaeota archaeon]